jgi:hypothetical protein
MKELSFTILCLLAVAGAAFAQGIVNWLSISPAAFTAQTNATKLSPLFGGGSTGTGTIGNTANSTTLPNGYHFELLYLPGPPVSTPTTLAALAAWQDSGLSAAQTGASGRVQPVNPTTAATVPWAAGITDNIMMACWSSNMGNTWAQAWSTLNFPWLISGVPYFGLSNTGYEAPGFNDPGSTFIGGGPNVTGTPIQSLLTQLYIPAPEPHALALAGLSGLMLLLVRRRWSRRTH